MSAARSLPEATKDERLLLRKIITNLIETARPPLSDRRTEPRTPFFWPARITLFNPQDGDPGEGIAAFVVDLSVTGIGFVHQRELGGSDVILTLPDDGRGQPLHIRTIIERTVPRGDSWYLSGGRFIRKTRL